MNTNSNTIWKTIDGFSSYQVSNDGQVRKKKADGSYKMMASWMGDHHMVVKLTGDYTQAKQYYLHRIVHVTFGPEQPVDKPLVLHRDDDPRNNTVENLVWGDKRDNALMAVENGRLCPPELRCFLTRAEAEQVRALRHRGQSMQKIADQFGCSRWTVSNVVNNRVKRLAA